MRSSSCSILLLATLIWPSALLAKDWEAAFDRGEILVYEEKLTYSDTPMMVLKAVINAPPEKVWAIISRCANYTRTMQRIKASKELSRNGGNVVCQVTVDMPFPYTDLTGTTKIVHSTGNGKWSRRWKKWKGDYKHNSGSWLLTYFRGDKGRTMVVYKAHGVPKVWVPGWIRTMAQKKTMPQMIKKLRKLLKAKEHQGG